MKVLVRYSVLTSALILAASSQAKIIVVNTADNTDFSAGKTNLVAAIKALGDGDTITFNIPGAGVHEIDTPAGGYPLITKNNVTIDGYTQPGAVPNSNPIHAANKSRDSAGFGFFHNRVADIVDSWLASSLRVTALNRFYWADRQSHR